VLFLVSVRGSASYLGAHEVPVDDAVFWVERVFGLVGRVDDGVGRFIGLVECVIDGTGRVVDLVEPSVDEIESAFGLVESPLIELHLLG
jgi:hypothetical protein